MDKELFNQIIKPYFFNIWKVYDKEFSMAQTQDDNRVISFVELGRMHIAHCKNIDRENWLLLWTYIIGSNFHSY